MNRRIFVLAVLVVTGVHLGFTQSVDAGRRVSFNFFKDGSVVIEDGNLFWKTGWLLDANGQKIDGTSLEVLIPAVGGIVVHGQSTVRHVTSFTMNVDMGGGNTFSLGMTGAVDPKGRIVFNGNVTDASDPSHIGSPAQLRALSLPLGAVCGTIYLTLP